MARMTPKQSRLWDAVYAAEYVRFRAELAAGGQHDLALRAAHDLVDERAALVASEAISARSRSAYVR